MYPIIDTPSIPKKWNEGTFLASLRLNGWLKNRILCRAYNHTGWVCPHAVGHSGHAGEPA